MARLCVSVLISLKVYHVLKYTVWPGKRRKFFPIFFCKANLAGWSLARLISVGIVSASLFGFHLETFNWFIKGTCFNLVHLASVCFTAIINLLLFNLYISFSSNTDFRF